MDVVIAQARDPCLLASGSAAIPRVTRHLGFRRWETLGYARFELIEPAQTAVAALTQPTIF